MSVRRQSQLVGHCGPTCVSMLLEHQGVHQTQENIAAAAGVIATISVSGSRIDQLARAVGALVPDWVLMGNYHSDLNLIEGLLSANLYVGVEWQGRFRVRDSHYEFDVGHYSVITEVDRAAGVIRIVDPDDQSVFSDGVVATNNFLSRWWEDNSLIEGVKHRSYGLAFVIVPKARVQELEALGLKPVTFDFSIVSSVVL